MRELQTAALEWTLESLHEWGGAVIVADCGFGKTAVAFSLMLSLGRKTLWITHRENLMYQTKYAVQGKPW